jgi:hypothetical protein
VSTTPVTRRELIRLAAVGFVGVALGGCSGAGDASRADVDASSASESSSGASTSPTTGSDAGDVALVTEALAAEQGLLELCRTANRAHRQLRAELSPVAANAERHAAELRSALTEPSDDRTMVTPALPRSLLGVRAMVQQRVRAEQRGRAADTMNAASGALARLMASMAASHAMTASVLAEGHELG